MLTPIIWSIKAFFLADGSCYEGQFSDNNIHGRGIYKWSNNITYYYDWRNNKMDGVQ